MGAFVSALVGVVVTLVCFFLPLVGSIAPLIGGFVGAYWQKLSVGSGVLSGIYMGLIMILPGLLFSGILIKAFPKIGIIVGGGLFVITLLIAVYTAILGMVGGAIAGLVSQK